MRVFVEVLAVWQDVESWAYCADVTGQFVLDASLPGSDPARVPAVIDPSQLTADFSQPKRVPLVDLQMLGFRDMPDLLAASIRVPDSSQWLIVTEHPGDHEAEARLGVYAQTVAQALTEVRTIQSSRLTWAMLEHLLPTAGSVAHAADSAVAELAAMTRTAAWLGVFSNDGATVLTAGDFMGGLTRPVPTRTPDMLVVPVDIGVSYHAVVGIRRVARPPLTGGNEELLRLAAAALGTWLGSAIERHATEQERRGQARTFDDVLKQRLDAALADGTEVSVVLVSLGRDRPRASVVHDYVARIRRELRPADMTGRLSSGHIGVFLHNTSSSEAQVVIQRLREAITADLPPALASVSMNFALVSGTRIRPADATPLVRLPDLAPERPLGVAQRRPAASAPPQVPGAPTALPPLPVNDPDRVSPPTSASN
jgi:hypothetical protein